MKRAYFGQALETPAPGGTQIAVYVVPVFEGRLTVFDVTAREARGRWLPWDVLPWGANPYETASELVDDWCDVALADLSLVDVMSFAVEGGGWELAVIFRAELSSPARGEGERAPYVYPAGNYDAIGNFDPVDLERWVTGGAAAGGQAGLGTGSHRLLF